MDPQPIIPASDVEVLEKVIEVPLTEVEEKGIVIVHCRFEGEGALRIWRSTFLVDSNSNHRSKLLHAENIALAPQWLLISGTSGHSFTLYFEALPKSCTVFNLHEIIPQPDGFLITGIARNNIDVYRLNIE